MSIYTFFILTFFTSLYNFYNIYTLINYSAQLQPLNAKLALQKCNSTSEFTIHGLWTDHGQFCKNNSFELDKINTLIPVLNTVWYSCFNNVTNRFYYSNVDFWKHEYNKHGSCFTGLDEFDYFNTTIALYNSALKTVCDPNKLECLIYL